MADDKVVELEYPGWEGTLVYDDYDTTARQAYVEVMLAQGWKKVPKSRRTTTDTAEEK